MVRMFAQVVGVVLILVGIVGFFLGNGFLGLNVDTVENIVHLLTGAIFLYAGFGVATDAAARPIVMGLGVLYIIVLIVGILSPTLFGLLPYGYHAVDHIIHGAVGILSLAVAYMQPSTARPAV